MFSKVQIAPSFLSADFMNFERDVRMIEQGAPEWLHIDVMDGHFVPNLTIGPPVIKALHKITTTALDVHLMISNPAEQLDSFLSTGAELLTLHIENANGPARGAATAGSSPSIDHIEDPQPLIRLIDRIHDGGSLAGIALNPDTPVAVLEPFISLVDMVVVMSVHPGFGGQSFIMAAVDKVAQVVALARQAGADPLIEVDGGINVQTAPLVTTQGADVLVAGNAVFGAPDPLVALQQIRDAVLKH
ncbi:MAG: ribulose-phosphate 3-epimerase [Coriobacteriia bacterium]|nr:ribulose-phosphate 3-epimerase [Coriobacteriia bacterium]